MTTKRDNEIARLLATIASLNETIVSLKQMITSLEQTIAEQKKTSVEQQKTIDKLTQELLSMNNKFTLFFGKKTEKQKKETPTNSPSAKAD